jgi:hypothetical protein
MFESIVVLTYAFIASIPLATFSWLCYITLYNANSLKILLNYVIVLVLFKANAFPFKNKDKSHIFQAKATFTLCRAAPCLFCFEAICDRYFLKLNCFKLIGWFNHHNVFPPIRSVCYRFLHCDYRKLHCGYKKLHCDYRKLHCDLIQKIALQFGINCTEINQSQSSNTFMYIIRHVSRSWSDLALCRLHTIASGPVYTIPDYVSYRINF